MKFTKGILQQGAVKRFPVQQPPFTPCRHMPIVATRMWLAAVRVRIAPLHGERTETITHGDPSVIGVHWLFHELDTAQYAVLIKVLTHKRRTSILGITKCPFPSFS
jgi:hypothetical protein